MPHLNLCRLFVLTWLVSDIIFASPVSWTQMFFDWMLIYSREITNESEKARKKERKKPRSKHVRFLTLYFCSWYLARFLTLLGFFSWFLAWFLSHALSFWKCKFPMTRSVRYGRLVGRSAVIHEKGRGVTHPCSYRNTCYIYFLPLYPMSGFQFTNRRNILSLSNTSFR